MDKLAMGPVTMCLSKITLAAGTTTTISNTGTTTFLIKGVPYTKAAMTNAAVPVVDISRGSIAFRPISANQGTVFLVGFDSGGNVRVGQGEIRALDSAGAFIVKPQLPTLPATVCPVGKITAKAGATAVGTWTFGTNNLSSVTGLTFTFEDVVSEQERP